jgi:RNA polymerase sigma-70 factor (ECF subfamily)
MEAHLRPVADANAEQNEPVDSAAPDLSFEEFYEANRRHLFTALCLVSGNRHEAEEIMQDAFLRVFERWDRVVGVEDPEGYLFRAAMNVFRNRYRRAVLAVHRTLSPARSADDLAAVEARDEFVRLLRRLAPRERAAIVLTAILDLPAEEAGRMLGIKAGTVRALTARARTHMKQEVVDHR